MKTWTVGLDVGVRSAHRAQVVNEQFEPLFHACFPTDPNAMERFLQDLASRHPAEGAVRFVLEPTGSVWKTLAAYLIARGYAVYQATPSEVHGMRAALGHRHRKTDTHDPPSRPFLQAEARTAARVAATPFWLQEPGRSTRRSTRCASQAITRSVG